MSRRSVTRLVAAATIAILTLALAGSAAVAKTAKDSGASTKPVTLRLGYFANVTHAPALVGMEGGILTKKLGKNVTLELKIFNSGTEAVSKRSKPVRSTPATSGRARRSRRGASSTRA